MRKSPDAKRFLNRILALAGLLLAAAVLASGVLAVTGSETGSGSGMAEVSAPERASAERPAARVPLAETGGETDRPESNRPKVEWRNSNSTGTHSAGSLEEGVLLPARGPGWFTWDPILRHSPNRAWRRWGSDRLLGSTLKALRAFRLDHPAAPRVAIGDLSRPQGGDFGPRFGSIGHASHQNGLDVDIYYPRRDRRLRPPDSADQVNLELAQSLVDRLVAAGAEKVFVGPSLGLTGPADIVVPLVNHDNHLHVRLPLGS